MIRRNRKLFSTLSLPLFLFGCSGGGSGSGSGPAATTPVGSSAQVQAATLSNNQLSLAGTALDSVISVKVTQNSSLIPFSIISQTATSLLVGPSANATISKGSPLTLVLSSSQAQASVTLTVGVAGTTNITSTPYSITMAMSGYYFTYNGTAAGTINLPAISGLSDGFEVTIMRQVPYALTLTPNSGDLFPNGASSIEMQGQNLASVTLTKMGTKWNVTHKSDDCVVGQPCWNASLIYFGTSQGHQYFTTPGGCTNSSTPTCAGGLDTLKLAWANNSGTTAFGVSAGAADATYGYNNTVTLAANFTDTDAAKYCKNMNYAGYTDWYLPAMQELRMMGQMYQAVGGADMNNNIYWSSSEAPGNLTYYFFMNANYGFARNTLQYVRCVRRF